MIIAAIRIANYMIMRAPMRPMGAIYSGRPAGYLSPSLPIGRPLRPQGGTCEKQTGVHNRLNIHYMR